MITAVVQRCVRARKGGCDGWKSESEDARGLTKLPICYLAEVSAKYDLLQVVECLLYQVYRSVALAL